MYWPEASREMQKPKQKQIVPIQSRTAEIKFLWGQKACWGRGAEGKYGSPLPSNSAVKAIVPSEGEEAGQRWRKSGAGPAAVSATKLGAPLQQTERELLRWEKNLSSPERSVRPSGAALFDPVGRLIRSQLRAASVRGEQKGSARRWKEYWVVYGLLSFHRFILESKFRFQVSILNILRLSFYYSEVTLSSVLKSKVSAAKKFRFTHVMTRVSSPGSLRSPSTNTEVLVKLWTVHVCPSSILNLRRNRQRSRLQIPWQKCQLKSLQMEPCNWLTNG